MEFINILDNETYLKEYIKLCSLEWGSKKTNKELDLYIEKKVKSIKDKVIVAIGLLENNTLLGFISLLKYDGEESKELTPWYGTMYVKKEYRNQGLSKLLHNKLIESAKDLNYNEVYLKTDLINYYEKFGAVYLKELKNKEKLYKIVIH